MDTSKYKALYLQETDEHLSGIEKGLLAMEAEGAGPSMEAAVDDLFRHYHSIKGMSASMGYEPLAKLAHAQENLLDLVRSKKLPLSIRITTALFKCFDAMRELYSMIESDKALNVDIDPYLEVLKSAARPGATEPVSMKSPAPATETRAQTAPELKISHLMKVEGKTFDDLLSTVGDLLMNLSTFKALSSMSRSIEFKDGVHSLGKSIAALQSNILSARMLPVSDLTEALPRLVRDMARKNGKEVALKLEGTALQLDRAILEDLGSPLVHTIRNAIDHGIETPEQRVKAGKPSTGTITISAHAVKDRAVISVADDGRGVDIGRIKEKVRAMGASIRKLDALSDKEALMLICLPGLSGADKVTDTSGRGVGMDVVKAVVDGLGGALDIESTPGVGTTVRMELPRSSSIIKALMLLVDKELFLAPLSKIEKIIEVEASEIAGGTVEHEGSSVPVAALADILGMEPGPPRETYTVVITETGSTPHRRDEPEPEKRFVGLKVDDFGVELDAYIKPLTPPISRLWGVSGIMVMGNGRPVFLLDIAQIVSRAIA